MFLEWRQVAQASYQHLLSILCYDMFSLSLHLDAGRSSKGVAVGMITFPTSTECYANDTPCLTSLAWCARTKCPQGAVMPSKMEYFQGQQAKVQKATGVRAVPAKWSYDEARN